MADDRKIVDRAEYEMRKWIEENQTQPAKPAPQATPAIVPAAAPVTPTTKTFNDAAPKETKTEGFFARFGRTIATKLGLN